MITAVIFTLACQDQPLSAGQLVSKMIARYHDAKALKGDCVTKLQVGAQQLMINSTFQIERPLKIYLQQTVSGAPSAYTLTSDGKEFSYNKPLSAPSTDRDPKGRLIESIGDGTSLGDIYSAAGESLAERSAVIDIVVGDLRDLQRLKSQWATLELAGTDNVSGVNANHVTGKWRLNALSPVSATYDLYITSSGDLVKYSMTQLSGVDKDQNAGDLKVSREYQIHIDVDPKVDPKLFTVMK